MTRSFTVAATFTGADFLQPTASARKKKKAARQMDLVMMGNLILAGSGRWKRLYCKVRQKGDDHLRVGMIGTGAISNLHARAYRNIGYKIIVCTDVVEDAGRRFAEANGCEFVKRYEEV